MANLKTYEECLPEIDREISKRKNRWLLSSISWLDYEDVAQIIRIHIFKKWDQYQQHLPLGPWINMIISNQTRNIVRNLYGNYSKPCLTCSENQGDNLCGLFGTQCNTCPLYAKWEKGKKRAHDVKLTLPLENHQQEVHNILSDNLQIDQAASQLHQKMKLLLKPVEWKVYRHLYIQQKEEDGLAKILGFKSNENGRSAGYKMIFNLKKAILVKVKKVLSEGEIDLI